MCDVGASICDRRAGSAGIEEDTDNPATKALFGEIAEVG